MTDRQYTEGDLRAAAALMHYGLTICPDPADATAALDRHPAWVNIEPGSDEDEELRESVVELVSGAADVSEWAVSLGADGLKPSSKHLSLKDDDRPIVRVHFAFDPDMPAEIRQEYVDGIGAYMDRRI
jgi:hypothetical protein